MLLPRVILLWHTVLSSATEDSENLSPLAKNILATLSSSGNAVMRRDIGHGPQAREDSDLSHRVLELTSLGTLADAKSHGSQGRQDPEEVAEEDLSGMDSLEETTAAPMESESTTEPWEPFQPMEEPSSTTTRGTSGTSGTSGTGGTKTDNTTAAASKSSAATGGSSTTPQGNSTAAAAAKASTTTTSKALTASSTVHHEVQFTRVTTPGPLTTTHSPAHLQAIEVGIAAANAARAEGRSPDEQAARAGEAAAAAAAAAGLGPMDVVKAAGHAASAAAKALGLAASQQVQAAVLAAEVASLQAQLSPDQEASAVAAAALYAAQAAGLSPQEQATVAAQATTSVRKGLQDALASKIKEMHAANHPATPVTEHSDKAVELAAAAAARAAHAAAAVAEASEKLAHGVDSNTTENGASPQQSAEQRFRDQIKEMIDHLAEQVSATSFKLDNLEKQNRHLSEEKADAIASTEPPEEEPQGELPEKPHKKGRAEAPTSPTSRVKIPGHMKADEQPKYWTQNVNTRALEKPVHPHNRQEALMTPEEVAALSPDQVAAILTLNRELLAMVTAKLSSGVNLSTMIFDTDGSQLPSNPPTEKALDAIMEHPEVAKKALNLTLSVLGRGVRKLNSGKAFADVLFGSDTSHLTIEKVKSTISKELEALTTDGKADDGAKTTKSSEEVTKEQEGTQGTTTKQGTPQGGSEGGTQERTKVLGVELPGWMSLQWFNPMAFFRN